jgi:hypothetical protein
METIYASLKGLANALIASRAATAGMQPSFRLS